MPPAFRQDPSITRQVGFVDLIFAAVVAFVLFPAIIFGCGYFLMLSSDSEVIQVPAAVLAATGYTGLFAWVGSPVAIGVGWWATRTGRTGWVSAVLYGAYGGAALSLIAIGGSDVRNLSAESLAIAGAFALAGAVYGSVALIALRWLRADLLKSG